MSNQSTLNYDRIAAAINFIQSNFQQQPGLEEIAAAVHLSPFHFQKLFTDWAGVSPKKFLQYISIEHAKKLLRERSTTLSDTAYETGLSGAGRLHDLFLHIEGMSPAEFKNKGQHLSINYSFAACPFGNILIATTVKGICYLAFYENESAALTALKSHFPSANFIFQKDALQQNALAAFQHGSSDLNTIKLHLRGSGFQLKVWEALLSIPPGQLVSYGDIAHRITQPNAARAVGSAIGSNPVAFLIPCHRVIQATGVLGGYMWGSTRKAAIIGWEAADQSKRAKSIPDMSH